MMCSEANYLRQKSICAMDHDKDFTTGIDLPASMWTSLEAEFASHEMVQQPHEIDRMPAAPWRAHEQYLIFEPVFTRPCSRTCPTRDFPVTFLLPSPLAVRRHGPHFEPITPR